MARVLSRTSLQKVHGLAYRSCSGWTSQAELVGKTPLIEVKSLSRATGNGSTILAKCEHMNPGGSVKDRAALGILRAAQKAGKIRPGDTLVEGTGGNTGIGLAMMASSLGFKCKLVMPESTAIEKQRAMRAYGAEIVLCPSVPFTDERHYFHTAARIGQEAGHFFTNQFENLANSQAHYESTGPELWEQTAGRLDGFICATGTGGTIGGVASWFRDQGHATKAWIIDCQSSGIFPLIREGAGYITPGESPSSPEGATAYDGDRQVRYIARSGGDSRAFEGIGIDRVTKNFARAFDAGHIDGCFVGPNEESVQLAHYLMKYEGLCIGPSAALNLIGAVWLARRLGPGSVVATVICDSGERYASKLLDPAWLEEKKLPTECPEDLEAILKDPAEDAVTEFKRP
eukprot:TRINITY_DN11591_c0_g1_i1.p1 TRINITY_DN11591_c0_g1~~TRINITY_DN11591_c0_g1_i1.p1  ORF type:complete len:426 (+),score=83.50 TRINITY_DN11591_c0_g1_i1:77-1279(+)